jgi:undecaprenyl-diphosphatase
MSYLIHIDYFLFHWINQILVHTYLDFFFVFITDLHKQVWFKSVAYPLLFFIYFYKYQKKGILYFCFCLLSLAVTDWTGSQIIKNTVERPRPFNTPLLTFTQRSKAHGSSFISNHAANMFAFATYTSVFFPPIRFAIFAFAALVAYSRVYNGVHFPLDVVCGALWGVAVATIFSTLVQLLSRRYEKASK